MNTVFNHIENDFGVLKNRTYLIFCHVSEMGNKLNFKIEMNLNWVYQSNGTINWANRN